MGIVLVQPEGDESINSTSVCATSWENLPEPETSARAIALDALTDALSALLADQPWAPVTLTAAGSDESVFRASLAALERELTRRGIPSLFPIAREPGAGPHSHGVLPARKTPEGYEPCIPLRELRRIWSSCAKLCARDGRSVHYATPTNLAGWLGYSTRSLTLSELPSCLLVSSAWAALWQALPLSRALLCVWCRSPLTGAHRGDAKYCRRSCKTAARRAARAQAEREAAEAERDTRLVSLSEYLGLEQGDTRHVSLSEYRLSLASPSERPTSVSAPALRDPITAALLAELAEVERELRSANANAGSL
jgi:hypothetical protein